MKALIERLTSEVSTSVVADMERAGFKVLKVVSVTISCAPGTGLHATDSTVIAEDQPRSAHHRVQRP